MATSGSQKNCPTRAQSLTFVMALRDPDPSPSPARLFRADPRLSDLILAAICRDTTQLTLAPEDRFNLFPANPTCSLTAVHSGSLHRVNERGSPESALPALFFAGPSRTPLVSWSPGPIRATTVCFFPDAWLRLTGVSVRDFVGQLVPAGAALPAHLMPLIAPLLTATDQRLGYEALQTRLLALWRPASASPAPQLADWMRATLHRAAFSGLGQSPRQIQRRIRHWLGLTEQDLHQFIRLERLMFLAGQAGSGDSIATVAAEAGFSDQAHMGRTLRRLTGYSPARINALIAKAEPFWCYRLLGEFY